MFNLFKSELFRISKTKSFWILSVVLIIVGQISPGLSSTVNGQEMTMGSAITGAMGFLDSLSMQMLYIIMVAGFISSYVCAAFEQRTLQDSIAAGGGRGTILLSKSLSLYAAIFVMLLVYSISYMISVMLFKDGGLGIENDVLLRMILAFVAVFFQMAAQATLVIFAAFALKRVGLVTAIAIAFFSVGILLIMLGASQNEWLANIIEFTPIGGSYSVTSGFTVPFGNYFQLMAVNAAWIAGLLLLTYRGFRKAELQ